MSKKAESAGPELEKAGAIAHQGDQQSSTANGPAQAKDIKASREQLSSVDVPQLNRLSEPSAGDCQSKVRLARHTDTPGSRQTQPWHDLHRISQAGTSHCRLWLFYKPSRTAKGLS